jgi:hypothetical protein
LWWAIIESFRRSCVPLTDVHYWVWLPNIA